MTDEFKIALAPLDSTDMGLLRCWRNDPRIWRWTRQYDLITDAEQVRWFNKQSEDSTIRMWKVVALRAVPPKDEGTGKATWAPSPIGVCGLTSIDYRNSRAEFSLYIAPDLQGRGFGKATLSVLLEHGFQNLGLGLIWGETFDGNPAAKLFEKLGMVKEGTRRRFYWKDGNWTDAHLYSITREEWLGRSASAVDRSGTAHRGDLEPRSGGLRGTPSQQGVASTGAARSAKEGAALESAKSHLAREKKGAAKARSSR